MSSLYHKNLSTLSRYYTVKFLFMMQAKKIHFYHAAHFANFCKHHAHADMLKHKTLKQKCRHKSRHVLIRCYIIDETIKQFSQHWSLERIHPTDLSILRLGTYEILYSKTPKAIIIDEALKLAKEFGEHKSPQFINGILDAIAKSLD